MILKADVEFDDADEGQGAVLSTEARAKQLKEKRNEQGVQHPFILR
jgi:hypothetical protein